MAEVIENDSLDELRDENNRLLNENKMLFNLLDKYRQNLLSLRYYRNVFTSKLNSIIKTLDKEYNNIIDLKHNRTESVGKSEDNIKTEIIDIQSNSSSDTTIYDNCVDIESDYSIQPKRQKFLMSLNKPFDQLSDKLVEKIERQPKLSVKSNLNLSLNLSVKSKGSFKCDYNGCGQLFESNVILVNHLRTQHNSDIPFKCRECDHSFESILGLQNHMSSHSTKTFDCHKCDKQYRTEPELATHLSVCQAIGPINGVYKCEKCEFTTEDRDQLKRHFRRTHSEKFQCVYKDCNKQFIDITGLNKHQRMCHRIWSCEWTGCDKTFKSQHYFKEHKSTHLGIFQCSRRDCRQTFEDENSLKEHRKSKHWRTLSSEECVKHCQWPGCGKSFKSEHYFEEHKSTHLGIFLCDRKHCRQTFDSEMSLKQHRKSEHPKNVPRSGGQCDWPGCEYEAKQSYKLLNHKRVHLGIKEFKCGFDNCDKSFVLKRGLEKHELTHRKRHFCLWPGCDYKFATNQDLNKHMNTHMKRNRNQI